MKKIVCHGDSLTEASDLDKNHTWPTMVANRLNVEILNSGIGGDTSGGLLARFHHDVVQNRPNIVIILGGTNDLWWDLEINLIQANIFAMACQAQYHDIAPVIGLPLPLRMEAVAGQEMMEPLAGYEKCVRKLTKLVEAIKTSAEKSDIPCLDFYRLFIDDQGSVRNEYFLEDGLHPNKKGHALMAASIVEHLQSLFSF